MTTGATVFPFQQIREYRERRGRLLVLKLNTELALDEKNYPLALELARKQEKLATELANTTIHDEAKGHVVVGKELASRENQHIIEAAQDAILAALEGLENQARAATVAANAYAERLLDSLKDLDTELIGLNQLNDVLRMVPDRTEAVEIIRGVLSTVDLSPGEIELYDKLLETFFGAGEPSPGEP